MDDSDNGSSTFQTLASVLSAGLGAYADSQNNQPVTVTTPGYQTAYGYAGSVQPTPSASVSTMPAWVLPAVVLVGVAFLLLGKVK